MLVKLPLIQLGPDLDLDPQPVSRVLDLYDTIGGSYFHIWSARYELVSNAWLILPMSSNEMVDWQNTGIKDEK